MAESCRLPTFDLTEFGIRNIDVGHNRGRRHVGHQSFDKGRSN